MTAAPTPRELEERVASAMWALMYPDHPWDAGEYVGKDMYRLLAKAARAVVREALAEPTPEMLDAAFVAANETLLDANDHCQSDEERSAHSIRPLYRAMLAASPLRAAP